MAGILSYSVHVPRYRLSAETVAGAWGRTGRGGTKAVANFDEDSLTMAHAAATPIATGSEGEFVFASTTSPFAEKSSAAFIAQALNLPGSCRTRDAAGSLRCASRELVAALKTNESVLLTAADLRLAPPGAPEETGLGDAAAAIAIGSDDAAIARLVAVHSVSREFTDQWRLSGDRYVKTDDPRFAATEGYARTMTEAIRDCMRSAGLESNQIHRAAVFSPDPKSRAGALSRLGFDPRAVMVADPAGHMGLTGAAHPLLLLAALLESAKPGELLLWAAYGDGADVAIFEATDRLSDYRSPARLDAALAAGKPLTGYAKYLAFRGLIAGVSDNETVFASHIQRHRDEEGLYRLLARVCQECKRVDTLRQPTCPKCGNTEKFSEQALSNRGKVFTFTREHYYPSPDETTGMCVVDLDGGGRLTVQLTDAAGEIAIGADVELTLRRLHKGGGMINYFWKCRPRA